MFRAPPVASKWPLLWPMLLVIVVPLIVAWFVYPETHLPPKFGVFPPVLVEPFPAVLVALGSLFNGFFWEVWNWGSAHPDPSFATNPNYWVYNIPYVNVIHLFAEMPLLGFAGYLPFGILVWLFFIWAGQLFGFDTSLDLND